MLNWSDFEIIVAIAETKTLSAAARKLGVNQSTISRGLKRMEDRLDEALFKNRHGFYELTPKGKPYFQTGKSMEKAVSKIEKESPKNLVKGTVRLSTVEALVGYLIDRISEFR